MYKRYTIILVLFILISGCAVQRLPEGLGELQEEETEELKVKDTIKPLELKELIDEENEDYLLIDVRTEQEYKEGHIPTAINIPHIDIESNLDKIPKDKLIIVYCKIGGRASTAATKLKDLGYKNVINFGGIDSYKYELEK
jgi:rhodanese-related sulfurtransferase